MEFSQPADELIVSPKGIKGVKKPPLPMTRKEPKPVGRGRPRGRPRGKSTGRGKVEEPIEQEVVKGKGRGSRGRGSRGSRKAKGGRA